MRMSGVLHQVKKERREQAHLRLEKTLTYLEQSGMSVSELDSLGVIHVTGTKGKGRQIIYRLT